MDFDLGTVGGDEGVGEDDGGFGKEGFGLFVAGADVGEEELLGVGLEGEGGGLRGGAVELLGGDGGKGIVEGTFEAEEVHVMDIGEDGLGVGGVGAVGIAAGRLLATGLFFDEVAVGGDGVQEGEGVDEAVFVFEEQERAFGVGEFVVAYLEFDMAVRYLHDVLHDAFYAGGGVDVDGVFVAAEVHAAEEAWEPEEMVAMEVGDADLGEGLQLLVVYTYLGLGVFATVEEYAEAVEVDDLSATMAHHGGGGSA